MRWQLDHAMIPAPETAATRRFLSEVLDMEPVAVPPDPTQIDPMGPEHLLLYVDASGREVTSVLRRLR